MGTILITIDTDWSKWWLKGLAEYVDTAHDPQTLDHFYEATGLYLYWRVQVEYRGEEVQANVQRITSDIIYGRQLTDIPIELLLEPWNELYQHVAYLLLDIHHRTTIASIEFLYEPRMAKAILVHTRPK